MHDESDDNLDDTELSNGNYSPPAWRRLENGDRWYGNWRGGNDIVALRTLDKSGRRASHYNTQVFEEARRTRLPTGSVSPEKGRTPEPGARDDDTVVKMKSESMPPLKNHVDGNLAEDQRQRAMTSMPPDAGRDNCKCPFLALSECAAG